MKSVDFLSKNYENVCRIIVNLLQILTVMSVKASYPNCS